MLLLARRNPHLTGTHPLLYLFNRDPAVALLRSSQPSPQRRLGSKRPSQPLHRLRHRLDASLRWHDAQSVSSPCFFLPAEMRT
jgi:hypothetical protein